MKLAEAVAATRSGPQGPGVAAIFDFGGAVAGAIRIPWYRRLFRHADPQTVLLAGIRTFGSDGPYSRFLQQLSRALAGRSSADLDELGERLFRRTVYGHLYPEAWQLIRTHAAAGHTVVLTSSLTRFQVAPAATALGIEHVLCTEMATEDDILTGFVAGKPLWGNGKADAAREFAAARGIDLGQSYAYSACGADVPLLAQVGHPVAVDPDPRLTTFATEQNWPTLGFRPRREPTTGDVLRTVAGLVALLVGAFVGVLSKSYTRDRRKMADALMVHGSRFALRTIGVRITVSGKEKALAPRPAIFLFNHQSQFDVIVVPNVLIGGVTGIGKKELTHNPIFGPLLRFVGVTFIDRANTAEAKAQLRPVVDTLRGGLSIALAPEGTRSYTPSPGPFKKGGFHMAIQAGVPIIPVVIRNAGEISWRNSMIARRGTVDVAFLDPIDVSGWDPDNMTDNVEAVRGLFTRTLLDWPSA
ncbi:HAD-IB family hydrolase [Nocardia arthritidis]|uniref:1-acyl-sn-glycerol-3-phosphate acyltransferase n=1 Tax=Nocardia arthritidis TaxID=228602 RepID=A0A6G9Y697_9NOCA|nr:HAD-IB family hydrolase [Nocardia arthritidis]QIS08596.1 HAD-IB family hydrolase [Nocardia arthritidis]